jgi:hypothetical protein
MTQTVYKYSLRIDDEQVVLLPKGAQMLTVQTQNDHAFLWALVDTIHEVEPRKVFIRGTGHGVSGVGRYISTFQMHGGDLVFHAFEGE